MSTKKAQLCADQVAYLEYHLEVSFRTLSLSRIQAIISIPEPQDKIGERIPQDGWILQTLDTQLCRDSQAIISELRRKWLPEIGEQRKRGLPNTYGGL